MLNLEKHNKIKSVKAKTLRIKKNNNFSNERKFKQENLEDL